MDYLVFVYSLGAPRRKSCCESGLTRRFGTADGEPVHLTPISVMADYSKLEKVPLHVPPLEELRDGKDIRMDLNVRSCFLSLKDSVVLWL